MNAKPDSIWQVASSILWRATACPLQAAFGKELVSEVKAVRDARDPCDPDKNTQTQSPVELPEDLDPHDPSAVRHPTMDLRHEVVHGLAMLFR